MTPPLAGSPTVPAEVRPAPRLVAVPAGAFLAQVPRVLRSRLSGRGRLHGSRQLGNGIAGGAGYGYHLLSVVLVANLAAMFLQSLPRSSASYPDWTSPRPAGVPGDLVSHSSSGFSAKSRSSPATSPNSLGLPSPSSSCLASPLVWGVALIGFEVLLLLGLTRHSVRPLEAFIVCLMLVISACFAVELALARPAVGAVLRGFVPSPEIVSDPAMLYIAIGILGATIMPHNLYLHSALVKSRAYERTVQGIRQAIRYSRIDVVVALTLAIFVNAAILILAASAFHGRGMDEVSIEDAYQLLGPRAGDRRGQHAVRRGPARLGPELVDHRHARRSDRAGRDSPTCASRRG